MQATAVNGYPSNARKCQLAYIDWYEDVPLFWVPFLGRFRIFGYHFLVQFDFFRNKSRFLGINVDILF